MQNICIIDLIPLFKVNILSANTIEQNHILSGSLINGKEANSNFQDLNKKVIETKKEKQLLEIMMIFI